MLLQRTRAFPLIVSACLQTVCLVQAFTKYQVRGKDDAAAVPFIFSVKQSCDDWVVFSWDPSPNLGFPHTFGPPHFSSCEITYMNQRSHLAKLAMVILHPDIRTIRLSNLDGKTHYAASMTCNETLTSDTVLFVTGYPCSNDEMEDREEKLRQLNLQKNDTEVWRHPVVVTEAANSSYSVTDMVLGLFFALCGVTIAGCFGYYYWKKRRHRQRILRIFGQSHSDPFLALHTPSDQPSTNFESNIFI
ncbi:uncharacterized protein [Littorina saxatilis]|uniref:Fibronectin type-III domain-containing protein n=1 Tax=Littorina saxatilis TaxID=31220 RepID=A0AAN9G9I6_9CAEN